MANYINEATHYHLVCQANIAFGKLADARPEYLTYEQALDLVLEESDKQMFLAVSKRAAQRIYVERHRFVLEAGCTMVKPGQDGIVVEAHCPDGGGIAPRDSYIRSSAPPEVTSKVNEWLLWAVKIRTSHSRCDELLKWFTKNKTPLSQLKFYFPALATLCKPSGGLDSVSSAPGILPQFFDVDTARNPMPLPHDIRAKCRYVAGMLTMYKLIENSPATDVDSSLLRLNLVSSQKLVDEFGSVS